jgi:hypothetical protein
MKAQRGSRGIALLFLQPLHYTLPPGMTQYPLYKVECTPQMIRTGVENLAPPGCDPQNIQCIASCYTSYVIPDNKVKKHDSIKCKLERDILLHQYYGTVIEK